MSAGAPASATRGQTGGRADGQEAGSGHRSTRPSDPRPSDRGPSDPLSPCVHCGFCLPSCPTYIATADESDSPRGRIVLMRALERGEIGPEDDALAQHLDACLGCRGCEPVCPSGVAYGRGLELARERLFQARGLPPLARLVLGVFRREAFWRPIFTAGRVVRALGIARLLAGRGRLGFNLAMLAATEPGRGYGRQPLSSRAERGIFSNGSGTLAQDPSVASLPRDDTAPAPPSPSSAAASWTPSSATSTTPPAAPSRPTATR